MDDIIIDSGMKRFQLISHILRISNKSIFGEATFYTDPIYAGLEAMAQLAALHVRQQFQFERHVFLLKVRCCSMPKSGVLDGGFSITGDLCSQSSNAFWYAAAIRGPNGLKFNSELLIGARDYDERFSQKILKNHYRKIFEQLIEQPDRGVG